jgi:hypothetical protein
MLVAAAVEDIQPVQMVLGELEVVVMLNTMAVALIPVLQTLVVVVAVAEQALPVALEALVSSSSNTPHLLNPYLHSKVLASGLHLLA